ncbi:hypothetical protein [Streptomyces sp. KAU_LT]|uniref:hypothetical protein n=1 Tax=Streptomyces sp. KAU_LT TaxID=3046669 RepID=UPI0024B79E31|nr:hypothetical protein [Streptomyces sp. KAU_LT]MDI9829682.1 hypothetical protein [Streptomyces sp. KAU_LT]
MAQKTFTLNTEPHVATLGDTELLFQPETYGDEFLEAYEQFRDAQREKTGVDVEDLQGSSAEQLRAVTRSLRVFLGRMMLPESADLFLRVDVLVGGKVVQSFQDREEALEYAAGLDEKAAVQDALRLPDRILMELLQWVTSLYSGGSRPPTSRSGSSTASRRAGTPGKARSRSKG